MKLHQFLDEITWQNRQYCLTIDKIITLPTAKDCFFFSVEGANCHLYEAKGDKLTAVKNKAFLDLYAIANFNMLWHDWEFTPGRKFSEVHSILEQLDI